MSLRSSPEGSKSRILPRRPRPRMMEMVSLKHHEGLPRIPLEECRSQAQKCIDESRKTQANPMLSAAWLALAEEWVLVAEKAGRTKHDEPPA
jgi:hypothetical protein